MGDELEVDQTEAVAGVAGEIFVEKVLARVGDGGAEDAGAGAGAGPDFGFEEAGEFGFEAGIFDAFAEPLRVAAFEIEHVGPFKTGEEVFFGDAADVADVDFES